MQEKTPIRKHNKQINKTAPAKPKKKKSSPGKTTKVSANNPYTGQNVPVKTNNMMARKSSNQTPTSGFGFPGSVY